MRTDWNKAFQSLNSWPTQTLCVANSRPAGGRNLWEEDKPEILSAAKRNGFRQLNQSGKSITFIKP